MPEANRSTKCGVSCQTSLVPVCSVAMSDTQNILTSVYTTCLCMTYKEHHMQCAVSSWHHLKMMCHALFKCQDTSSSLSKASICPSWEAIMLLKGVTSTTCVTALVLCLQGSILCVFVSDRTRVIVTLELHLHGFQQSCTH